MVRDLTVGTPSRVMVRFAIPMLVSVVFQQFYSMADNIIAGQFISDAALDAVSIAYPVTMIYTAVALGINIGVNVVVSQLFGGKQNQRLKTAVSTSLIATTVVALLLTILGLVFCRPLLAAMQTPEDLMAPTLAYLRIYTGGLVFIFLYNTTTGIFSALGDTVTPLIFLVISSLGNVGVNILFVTTCGMGVDGLALATFLCQAVAALAAFGVMSVRLKSIPSPSYQRFSWPLLRSVSKLAIPGICQKSFVSVGNLLVQGVVNSFDASVPGIIGGFSSATKLVYFVVYINSSVGSSVASFTAQNMGGGKLDRVVKGLSSGIAMCFCLAIPTTAFFCLLPTAAMRIFVPAESVDIIAAGVSYLRIVAPFIFIIAIKQCCDGVLQGAGAAGAFMVSTFSDLILRVALAYILPVWFGHLGVWYAWPIGWVLGAMVSILFYHRGKWKEVHLLDNI